MTNVKFIVLMSIIAAFVGLCCHSCVKALICKCNGSSGTQSNLICDRDDLVCFSYKWGVSRGGGCWSIANQKYGPENFTPGKCYFVPIDLTEAEICFCSDDRCTPPPFKGEESDIGKESGLEKDSDIEKGPDIEKGSDMEKGSSALLHSWSWVWILLSIFACFAVICL